MIARSLFFVFLFVYHTAVVAQECPRYPAPCPQTSAIDQNRERDRRLQNYNCLRQEIQLENDMRDLVSSELERVARQHNWEMYEINEMGQNGPPTINVLFDEWQKTPFSKRPPHSFRISYILIVNQDSLKAWRNWIINVFNPEMQNHLEHTLQNGGTDPAIKKYQDSIKKYAGLYSGYVQSHAESFQQDIKNNNQKGLDT